MDNNEVNKGYVGVGTPIEEGYIKSFQENIRRLKKEHKTSSRIETKNNDSNIGRSNSSDIGVSYGEYHSSSNCDFI